MTPEQQALDYNPELQDVSRQRKLAELLMAQGMQQPQGQMISGYYVAPSFTQQLNPMANILAGQAIGGRADTEQAKLAETLRTQKGQALSTFQQLMSKPETRGQAMQFAASNRFLQPLAAKLAEGMKLGEGEKFVMPGMDGQSVEMASGGAKYHAPISIDTGNSTILLDPITKQKIGEFAKAHQPVAGQVLETENGPMLINTRTGQATPVMSGGQPLVGGKPLTESQGNATAFGMRMKESNQLLNNLEKQGVKDTGIVRSTVGGIVGMTPFVGEKMQQGVQSAMNVLPSGLGGPNAQQQETDAARKNFVTAVLRKESGAAISPSEFYTESQKYFPQPGDADSVIKQKQHARETAIKAMEIQAGPGKRQIEQFGAPKKVVNYNDLP